MEDGLEVDCRVKHVKGAGNLRLAAAGNCITLNPRCQVPASATAEKNSRGDEVRIKLSTTAYRPSVHLVRLAEYVCVHIRHVTAAMVKLSCSSSFWALPSGLRPLLRPRTLDFSRYSSSQGE